MYLVPRRITRNFRVKQVVDDDEEDEDDDADANADEQVDQEKNEESNIPSKNNDSKQEDKTNLSLITETNDSRPRTRRAVAEASDKSNDHVIEPCEDLYTRIKRSRRKIQEKPISKFNLNC